jgi:glutaryl-CoA dehydrogenase
VVVWARDTDDKRAKGFLVEKGTPGYNATRIDGKGSLRAVWQAQITLTDLRVPEDNRLPDATSFKDAGRVLAGTRNAVAWAALGHASAAHEIAVAYCSQRQQFGKPLVALQIVQERLVKILAEICSMQLYCLRLGRLIEEARLTDTIAAIAKMNNSRKARQVIWGPRPVGRQRYPARLPGDAAPGGHRGHPHLRRHRTIQTLIVGRDITGVGAFT